MVKSVTKNYTAPSFLFDNLAITHYILEIVVFFPEFIIGNRQTDMKMYLLLFTPQFNLLVHLENQFCEYE